jgi:hypothetical protein
MFRSYRAIVGSLMALELRSPRAAGKILTVPVTMKRRSFKPASLMKFLYSALQCVKIKCPEPDL